MSGFFANVKWGCLLCVGCRSDGQKRWMAGIASSPTVVFIGVEILLFCYHNPDFLFNFRIHNFSHLWILYVATSTVSFRFLCFPYTPRETPG